MMDLYNKRFKPKNRAGKTVALVCYFGGGALFLLSGSSYIKYAAWIQLAAIVLFCAAIYVTAIYLLREYTVAVEPRRGKGYEDEDEDLPPADPRAVRDLLVYEHRGKRTLKVCHLSMAELTGVTVVNKENRKQVKAGRKDKKLRKYTYDSEFLPPMQLEVRAIYEDEEFSLLLPYDRELEVILTRGIQG